MSDDGYLQSKLRENKEEIDEIKKQLFEMNLTLKSLIKSKEETYQLVNEKATEMKTMSDNFKSIDIESTRKMITDIVHSSFNAKSKEMEKKTLLLFNDFVYKLKKSVDSANSETKEMVDKRIISLLEEFLRVTVCEMMFDSHDALLKYGVIKEPFILQFSYLKLDSGIELEILIDYKTRTVKFCKGKGLSKDMIRRMKISGVEPREKNSYKQE